MTALRTTDSDQSTNPAASAAEISLARTFPQVPSTAIR